MEYRSVLNQLMPQYTVNSIVFKAIDRFTKFHVNEINLLTNKFLRSENLLNEIVYIFFKLHFSKCFDIFLPFVILNCVMQNVPPVQCIQCHSDNALYTRTQTKLYILGPVFIPSRTSTKH